MATVMTIETAIAKEILIAMTIETVISTAMSMTIAVVITRMGSKPGRGFGDGHGRQPADGLYPKSLTTTSLISYDMLCLRACAANHSLYFKASQ